MLFTSHRAEHDVGFQLSLFNFAIHKSRRVLLFGKRNNRNPSSCRFEQLTAAQQGIISNISHTKFSVNTKHSSSSCKERKWRPVTTWSTTKTRDWPEPLVSCRWPDSWKYTALIRTNLQDQSRIFPRVWPTAANERSRSIPALSRGSRGYWPPFCLLATGWAVFSVYAKLCVWNIWNNALLRCR